VPAWFFGRAGAVTTFLKCKTSSVEACCSEGIYDFVIPAQIRIVSYQVGDKITLQYMEDSPTSPVEGIGEPDSDEEIVAQAEAAAAAEAAAPADDGAAAPVEDADEEAEA
jgi:hypothetical protein